MNNKLLGILFIIIQVLLVKSEDELQECEVYDEDTCILSDGRDLKQGGRCVTNEGFVYKGIDDFGKCVYVRYSYVYDSDYKYNFSRENAVSSGGSSSGSSSGSSTDGPTVEYSLCNKNELNNCNKNTYYLFKDTGRTVLETGNSLGYLYYSDSSKEFTAVNEIGYFVNKNNNMVFSCSSSDGGKCKIASFNGECSEDTISEIFKKSGVVSICLDYNVTKTSIELSRDSGNRLVSYKEGNIFGISAGNYALVKVDEKSVTLNKNYNNDHIYVYAQNNKVIENKDQCPNIGDIDNLLMELKCEDAICTEVTEVSE